MARPEAEVVPGSVAVKSGKGAAVVSVGAGVSVKNLAETVRAIVGEIGGGRPGRIPVAVLRLNLATELIPVKTRMLAAMMMSASIAIFTSFCSIFFPMYSGVRPTMSPAMKTARMAKSSMPFDARADSAKNHLAELNVEQAGRGRRGECSYRACCSRPRSLRRW